MNYLLIAVGSAFGEMWRHYLAITIAARWGDHFPIGTLAVNVPGPNLIGELAGLVVAINKRVLRCIGTLG